MAKNFKDLSEQEILALAISLEETDARMDTPFLRAAFQVIVGGVLVFLLGSGSEALNLAPSVEIAEIERRRKKRSGRS